VLCRAQMIAKVYSKQPASRVLLTHIMVFAPVVCSLCLCKAVVRARRIWPALLMRWIRNSPLRSQSGATTLYTRDVTQDGGKHGWLQ